MHKRLFRSRQEKVIGGVCGGLAAHYDVDPTIIRLATILLVLGLGFPIVAYLVAWIIIPRQPLVATGNFAQGSADSQQAADASQPHPSHNDPAQAEAAAHMATSQMAVTAPVVEAPPQIDKSGMSAMVPGLALVAVGLFALLKGYFWWHWEDLIPVGLVVIGIYLIVRHLDLSISSKAKNINDSDSHSGGATEEAPQDGDSSLPSNGATNGATNGGGA